jgi:beta-glucosidase
VILLGGSAAELALRTRQLQDWAEVPLLLAADIEEGVGQRFAGATRMPPPLALGAIHGREPERAIALAEAFGEQTAREAVGLGLNWVLAPVCDVNNNPRNPVINVRAFGEDPATVAALAGAFIRGSRTHPVLTSAKHFPGHGDTAVDSHLDLPVLPHDRARLDRIELAPFRAAIAAGVDSIMTAHLLLPELDDRDPATLSAPILTDLLRRDLGYEGLIVTDALVMQAIAARYGAAEAAVLAFEAGADILLMPADPDAALDALEEAVLSGRIAEARLAESLGRIWQAKQRVAGASFDGPGHAWESSPPDLPSQLAAVNRPADRQLSCEVLAQSMDRQQARALTGSGVNLVLVDDWLLADYLGVNDPALTVPASHGWRTLRGDRQGLPVTLPSEPTLLQLFVRGNPFRGGGNLSEWAIAQVRSLLSGGHLRGLVVYGSPYLWQQLRTELPEGVPGWFSYGQFAAAQTLVMTEAFGSGAIAPGEFTT